MIQLPEHEPYPELWLRIEADLDFAAQLDNAIVALPEHEPGDVWESIDAQLQQQRNVAVDQTEPVSIWRSRSTWYKTWLAAASVVLLLGLGVWWQTRQQAGERITMAYTTETVSAEEPFSATTQADQHLADFIEQHCQQEVAACDKPEVRELKHQLDELNTRKEQVEGQLSLFGNDPELVQAQIKIENDRAEITKELVRVLRI